jgi:uncharacterized protein YjiS (DUF1127 family)
MLHPASKIGTAHPRPSLLSPTQALARLSEVLATWERRARERRMLREMSDHMLKDLGIPRPEAEREAGKPFWRG